MNPVAPCLKFEGRFLAAPDNAHAWVAVAWAFGPSDLHFNRRADGRSWATKRPLKCRPSRALIDRSIRRNPRNGSKRAGKTLDTPAASDEITVDTCDACGSSSEGCRGLFRTVP